MSRYGDGSPFGHPVGADTEAEEDRRLRRNWADEVMDNPMPAVVALTIAGVLGGWAFGISADQVGAVGALLFFVAVPLWSIASGHRHERGRRHEGGRRARDVREIAGEVAVVGFLLWLGWNLLVGAVEGPQPGDIVCDVFDPRLGDCVVEHVYGGE